jgi:hypothetical protein
VVIFVAWTQRQARGQTEEDEAVTKRTDQSEDARQWAITFYLVIAAITLAGIFAVVLTERYL